MSTISIHKEGEPETAPRYRAIAGAREQYGATMGQAIDALTADWGEDIPETVILIQKFQPDPYFTEAQQRRKQELLARRTSLTPEERAELERLLDEELDATIVRTSRSLQQHGR